MKTLTNLIPNKHVRFAGSIIGIAGYVRQFVDCKSSVDGLWAKIEADNNETFQIDFTQFMYALDVLLIIQEIIIDEDGAIIKVTNNEIN